MLSHLSLGVTDLEASATFYDALLAPLGSARVCSCDGPPGPRPRYGPRYYAAFVLDPDGHRLEVKARDQGQADGSSRSDLSMAASSGSQRSSARM